MPKIKHGESGTRITMPPQITAEGTSMLPVPRRTLASALTSQISRLPAKTMFEYFSAAASDASWPPSA